MDRAVFDAALDAASALMDRPRLERLAQAERVVIYSYGARGSHLAAQLRNAGVQVLVFDNAAASRERAAAEHDPRNVAQPLLDAGPRAHVVVLEGRQEIRRTAVLGNEAAILLDAGARQRRLAGGAVAAAAPATPTASRETTRRTPSRGSAAGAAPATRSPPSPGRPGSRRRSSAAARAARQAAAARRS